jgi:hypothetical protein
MMDISQINQMYGNHHHSTPHNGYQNSDIGNTGYPYFSASNIHHHHMHQQNAFSVAYAAQVLPNQSIMPQNHQNSQAHVYSQNTPHSHLYSPTALEYGIHTTPSNNTSPSQPYFDGEFFNQSLVSSNNNTSNNNNNNNSNNNGGSPSETHIISSDNGLSYTNLDYVAYQQAQQAQQAQHNQQFLNVDEKTHHQHHFLNEDLIPSSGNHYQGTWQNHGYSIENSENSTNQVMTSNNQLTSQINNRMISPDGQQTTSPSSPNQKQQQISQQVPQYKWMQVKRSLPKPQG